jgi:predicted secreted protein
MAGNTLVGYDGKLFYKIGGVAGGGSYVEWTNCKDVKLNCEKASADVSTRATGKVRARKGTLKDFTLETSMIVDSADANYTAIRDAFFDDSIVGIQFYDEDGGEGIEGDFEIFTFNHGQALEEGQMVDVTLQPTRSDNPPEPI